MDHTPHLLGLPNELILYILRQFLDLGDVWCLLQVSQQLRQFAIDTIHKRWKIELVFTPETAMKIQCRAALIALEKVSSQLSLQTRRNGAPVTFDGSFNDLPTAPRLSPPFLPMHNTHNTMVAAAAATTTTTVLLDRAHDITNNSNTNFVTDSDIDEQIQPLQQQQHQQQQHGRSQGFLPVSELSTTVLASTNTPSLPSASSSNTPSDDMDLDLAEEDDDDDNDDDDDDDDDEDEDDDDEDDVDYEDEDEDTDLYDNSNDDESTGRSYSPAAMAVGSSVTNLSSRSTTTLQTPPSSTSSSSTTPPPLETAAPTSIPITMFGTSPSPPPATATANSTRFNGSDFLLTTTGSDNKLFQDLMLKEERLHQRIICGIRSYKHKFVLIEDIDIRHRIRATVDVIFHHAVFVSALSRQPANVSCPNSVSNNRSLAAMMVRLLTRLDAAFPSYCREITYTLADHIKAFLEYTGYKLLAQRPTCLHERDLLVYPFIFGQYTSPPFSTSSLLLVPSSTSTTGSPNTIFESPIAAAAALSSSSSSSSSSSISSVDLYHYQQHQQQLNQKHSLSPPSRPSSSLVLTLHTIAACFDLMGAAFVGKVLGETHVECAVQRACELLSDDRHLLGLVKKSLLVNLLENWLTIKRGLVAGELCRLVRSEIDACSRQQLLLIQQQQQQQQRGGRPSSFFVNPHQIDLQDHESFLYRPSSLHTRHQLS